MSLEFKESVKLDDSFHKVLAIRWLTDEAFAIKMPKKQFSFHAGQHLSLGIQGDYQSREYSIFSGENDDFLEVLVKEVEGGYFSPKLGKLKVGDLLEVDGPFGNFQIDTRHKDERKFVFIASGTGIAPFRSIVRTYPDLDYQVIHGVRYGKEAYAKEEFDESRHVLCTTRDEIGDYHGRLTGYLKEHTFESNTHFYLCGNSNMIFDSLEILKDKGFDRDHIHCEVYF